MTHSARDEAERLNAEGTALARARDLAGAEAKYREAIAADPALGKAHANLGNVLRLAGRAGEAEAACRRAIELGGSALARRHLAVLLTEAGRHEEAEALDEAAPADERAELAASRAEAALRRDEIERAGASWLAVKALDPSHPRLAAGLAACVLELPFGPGLRCVVPNLPRMITPFVLREQGDWFEDEVRFVRKALAPGETAIDVGANFGVYALSLAAAVGPTGRVVAFEPARTTHRYVSESRDRLGFGWLSIERRALSDHHGTATFHHGSSPELSSLHALAGGGGQETVELGTLDDLAPGLADQHVALVKIDAEGEEVRILDGASRLLRDHQPLLLVELTHAGTFNRALVAKIEELGLRLYELAPGPLVLLPLAREQLSATYTLNAFACTPRTAARLHARGLVAEPAAPAGPVAVDDAWAAVARARRPPTMRPSAALEAVATEYARAQADPDVDARLGRLLRALGAAQALPPTLGSACATARLGAELGRREAALRAAEWALDEVDRGVDPVDVALAPVARFDEEPVRTTASAWVEAALVELILLRGGHSSLFNPELVPLARRSLASPHPCERARGVLRARGG